MNFSVPARAGVILRARNQFEGHNLQPGRNIASRIITRRKPTNS